MIDTVTTLRADGPRSRPEWQRRAAFTPTRVLEVEITEPLPHISPQAGGGGIAYGAANCLIRLYGQPLGMVSVDLPSGGLGPEELGDRIGAELWREIRPHLTEEGTAAGVPAAGIGAATMAQPCDGELERDAPLVSVAIPTLGRSPSLKETVDSLLRSRYPADRYEVVVVDNSPGGDEAPRPAELAREGGIRVVREPFPGAAAARNRGALEARGEIVAFADDDVTVDRDWLAALVRAFDRSDRVAAVGGLTLPRSLETQAQVWFEGFAAFGRGFERRTYELSDPPADQPLFPFTVGEFGSGQNMAVRREEFLDAGGFDPALGPGSAALDGEDIEAMLRLLVGGHRIVYEPAAIVWHEHPRKLSQLEHRVFGYGVGLTACLTKTIITHPKLVPRLLRKLPRGVAFALSPRSSKNARKPRDFPARFTRLELRGMAYGPLAYARSRRRAAGRGLSRNASRR